jgi:hypothetical protein
MGLFDLFKKPQVIKDEFFGTLRFMSFKDSSKDYFEGKGKFKPTGDIIEYFIKGDIIGPTVEQRDFFNKIQDSYDEIIAKVSPIVEDEFKNWKDDFKILDFKKEVRLVAVTIPRIQARPLIWDMSFESIHEHDHQIVIDFKDFEPDASTLDG